MAFGALRGSLTGSNASISTSLAATGSVAVSVGDLIFAVLFEQTTSTMSACGDNLHGAGTYTLFSAVDAGTTTARCAYKYVTTAGTLTAVTAVTNGGTNDGVIDAIVVEGPFAPVPFDVHPTDISNDITTPYLSPASGTLTPAIPEVAITWFASTGNATMTVAGPFTKDTEHAISTTGSVRLARQLIAASASSVAAASWTGTAPTDDVLGMAVFKGDPTLLCGFQSNAFQNDTFQMCLRPFGWFQQPNTVARLNRLQLSDYQAQSYFTAPTAAVAPSDLQWLNPLSRSVPIPRPAPIGGSPFVPKAATLENTTNTVWPLQLGEVARPIQRVAPQGYHLFTPKEATLDNTTNKVWPLTQGEIARPIARAAKQGHHLFVPEEATLENTITTTWPLTLGEVARPNARPAQQGHHLFVPKETIIDNTTNTVWPLTQGEKARPIPFPAPQGMWAFSYSPPASPDNNQTIDKWQQPLSRAVPIPRSAPLGGQPFIPKEATLENTVTPDNWMMAWQGPPRIWPIKVQTPPFVPREATLDNTITISWPLSKGEIARPIPRPAPIGGSPFIPKEATLDNTTNTVWPLAKGEIPRPITRVAPQGTWVFGREIVSTDNNITGMAWHVPLSEATRLAKFRAYPRGGSPFVPKEAVLENTGTVVTWLMKWQGPPRYRPPKLVSQPFVPREATIDNTIRGMAWHMPLSKAAKHAQVCLSQPFYGREPPAVIDIPVRRVFSDVYYY